MYLGLFFWLKILVRKINESKIGIFDLPVTRYILGVDEILIFNGVFCFNLHAVKPICIMM